MEGEASLADVLAHYDLGAPQAFRRIERGHMNELWFIEAAKGRFVLRRRHPDLRDTREIAGQHALVRHLFSLGFPAPSLVAAMDGESFVKIGGEVYEVQDYIAGTWSNSRSCRQLAVAARTLAQYHLAVSGFDHSALHRDRERYGIGALERILGGLAREWSGKMTPRVACLRAELTEQARDLESLCPPSGDLPELIIHGDYYAGNLIWRDGTIVGVVDYDQAHWCARVLELAEALIYFAREVSQRFQQIVYPGVLDLDRVDRFLRAYTELVRLSEAEVRALPQMMRIIWLCASLDPPLRSRLSLDQAAQALPEVLALADWASTHATDIIQMERDARAGSSVH